jgi:hypothetical protein
VFSFRGVEGELRLDALEIARGDQPVVEEIRRKVLAGHGKI